MHEDPVYNEDKMKLWFLALAFHDFTALLVSAKYPQEQYYILNRFYISTHIYFY
jgi:hypothetical protein